MTSPPIRSTLVIINLHFVSTSGEPPCYTIGQALACFNVAAIDAMSPSVPACSPQRSIEIPAIAALWLRIPPSLGKAGTNSVSKPSPASIPPAEGQSSSRQRGPLLVIAGLSSIGPISVDLYLPAMPEMGRDLAASNVMIQLTITTFMIGLAVGQAVIGPVSDTFGRRRPLLVGLAIYTISSLVCVIAPSVLTLTAARFVQGVSGSAGIVVSLAIVRDLYAGREAARYLALVRTLAGVGPLAAPVIGAQVLRLTDWRGVFVVQVVAGLLLMIAVAQGLRETHPAELRHPAKIRVALSSLGTVGRDANFLSYALPAALMTGAAFSYISGSSFVLQNGYGLTPQEFSLVFSLNVVSMVLAGLASAMLVRAVGPKRLFAFGLTILVFGPLLLFVIVLGTNLGVAGFVFALSVCLIGFGFGNPNAQALAMDSHPRSAGAAAGLFGILGFTMGAIAAPLAGATNASSGIGLGIQMFVWATTGMLLHLILRRRIAQRIQGSRARSDAQRDCR